MIKIIQKGRDVKEFKCKICDTLFTYEEEDLVKIQPDNFKRIICLKCPNCNHMYKWIEQDLGNYWKEFRKRIIMEK